MVTTESPKSSGLPRREFIKKTATAAAVVASTSLLKTPVYGQNQAPSANVTGANDRIAVGFIGVGNQGMAHVRSMKDHTSDNNVVLAAACDLSKEQLKSAATVIGDGCKTYSDYRKLLENKDIQAVCIATVDHWQAQTSIDAMNAGKHVYV